MNRLTSAPRRPETTCVVLMGTILFCLLLQVWLALATEINWDEFFYLAKLYAHQHGELTKAFQSFQVHLLGWVTRLPGDEIDQIESGRLFMLACQACTCILIYKLARDFFEQTAALLAVLAFASAGFTMIHGASFRADPVSAMFMMGALVVVARARPSLLSAVVAGALEAVAAMITIKIVLYAPAFLGIAAWRFAKADDRRRVGVWLLEALLAAGAAFAILYLMQLGLLPKATDAASRAGLGNAAETQIGAGFLPRSQEILRFILLSPLQMILLAIGAVSATRMLRRSRWDAIAVLGCGASLLCLLVYRNAFPYFFPFILAPAAILMACGVERAGILSRHSLLLAMGMTVTAAAAAYTWSARNQLAQRQVVFAVHRMFPEPVAYIDRNSMIASFPKRGFFMSTWGMQNYRRAGAPVFDDLLAHDAIPLVIANGPALEKALGNFGSLPPELSLFDRDEETLRANYIPHWGPLWVAGKKLQAESGGTQFEIAIPGNYTLEGPAIDIDGRAVPAGSILTLKRGRHMLSAPAKVDVTLRWGDHLPRPVKPFVGPVYRGF